MKFKSTYILLAGALALAMFIYIYEIRGGKTREAEKAKKTRVFDVSEADVKWVEITRPNAEPLRVQRNDSNGWNIVAPIEARADDGAVGSITWQLGDLSSTSVAAESVTDLAQFGLASPELSVKFGASSEQAIYFGKKLPVGTDSYATVAGSNRVIVVSQTARSAFDKQTIDLRDRRVFAIDEEKLTSLELATAEYHIKIDKAGAEWAISEPIKGDADNDEVFRIVDNLRSLEATDFRPSVMSAAIGLSTPEMTVTLTTAAGREVVKFFRVKDDEAYAWPEGGLWIYAIPPQIIDELPRPAESIRRRRVIVFERFDIEQIRIKPGAGKPDMLVVKNEAGDWEFAEPAGVKDKIVGSTVYDLLDRVENLEGLEFIDNPPGDAALQPVVVLYKVKSGDAKKKAYEEVATLYLGKDIEGGKKYAKGSGKQVFSIVAPFEIPAEPKSLTTAPAPVEPPPPGAPDFDEQE